MLLTEQEARLRWCPLARSLWANEVHLGGPSHQYVGAAGVNRDTPNGNIPACIASSCMAWRFQDAKQVRDIDLVTSDVVDEIPRRGYCGAFGPVTQGD
jgi:hypothetical protein